MLESSNPFKQDYLKTVFFFLFDFTGNYENIEITLLPVWNIQFAEGCLTINMVYHKH